MRDGLRAAIPRPPVLPTPLIAAIIGTVGLATAVYAGTTDPSIVHLLSIPPFAAAVFLGWRDLAYHFHVRGVSR